MRAEYNTKKNKNDWVMETWYEKAYVIVGVIYTWLFLLAFAVGLLKGIWESI